MSECVVYDVKFVCCVLSVNCSKNATREIQTKSVLHRRLPAEREIDLHRSFVCVDRNTTLKIAPTHTHIHICLKKKLLINNNKRSDVPTLCAKSQLHMELSAIGAQCQMI